MKLVIVLLVLSNFVSCSSARKNAAGMIAARESLHLPDSLSQLQHQGIDFIATGDIPEPWKAVMDFDKGIDFISNTFTLAVPVVKKDSTNIKAVSFTSVSAAGKINLVIFDLPCEPVSKNTLGKKVEVTVNNKRYTGCGKYLYDNRLNDHWVLERINNKLQEASSYSSKLPFLELDLQANKLTGSDGCNRISGPMEVRGTRIAFSPFNSTKMACNNNPAEKIFSEWLSNQLVDYFIKNDKLVLYLGDDSSLTFTRE
ncbi:MAG TPA: META domain-containing protein [Ferruginibacter sp.]|nr:META domain-containing protein [Ferruginibacter sp.]